MGLTSGSSSTSIGRSSPLSLPSGWGGRAETSNLTDLTLWGKRTGAWAWDEGSAAWAWGEGSVAWAWAWGEVSAAWAWCEVLAAWASGKVSAACALRAASAFCFKITCKQNIGRSKSIAAHLGSPTSVPQLAAANSICRRGKAREDCNTHAPAGLDVTC